MFLGFELLCLLSLTLALTSAEKIKIKNANIIQWQYFVPVQQGMPKNCSTDIDLVINHMDKTWEKG